MALSEWNLFVKKVYAEGKAKDSNYSFKQALSDASKRKSEMGASKSSSSKTPKSSSKSSRSSRMSRRSRKMAASASLAGGKRRHGRKTRRH